jgi:hypothetical protein
LEEVFIKFFYVRLGYFLLENIESYLDLKWKKDIDRDREIIDRERQKDRKTERQKHRKTKRQKDRRAEIQNDRTTER